MSDTPDQQESLDLNFHTDMPVGEILRRTRTHYGLTLQQIEGILRIRASQLDALEQGDLAKLPGRVYAIGFVRSYSEYLGLDGDKMVHLFKEQSVGRQKKPDLSFQVPATESRVPGLLVIGGSLFGVLVLIGFLSFMFFPKNEPSSVPPVPDTLTKSQLSEAPALVADAPAAPPSAAAASTAGSPAAQAQTGTTLPAEPAAPPAPANRIVLVFSDAVWVEIKNAQGAAILRRVLKPGDIYLVPDEPGLVMATGNAGGIRVKVDGREIAPLGTAGQIRRKIALDADMLLKIPAAN